MHLPILLYINFLSHLKYFIKKKKKEKLYAYIDLVSFLTGAIPNLLATHQDAANRNTWVSILFFPCLNEQPLGTAILSQKATSGQKKKEKNVKLTIHKED